MADPITDVPRRPRCGDFGHTAKGTGLPCEQPVLPGLTCCWWHGAGAPQTRAKAEAMLASLRVPATQGLMLIIYRWLEDTCPTCGYPRSGDEAQQRVIVQAAKAIYDRTGMGPRATLDVRATRDDLGVDVAQLTDAEIEWLTKHFQDLDQFKVRVRARLAKQPVVPLALEP